MLDYSSMWACSRLWKSFLSPPRQGVLSFYESPDVDVLKAAKNCWLGGFSAFEESIHDSIRSRGHCSWEVLKEAVEPRHHPRKWEVDGADFLLPAHSPRDVRSQDLFPFPGCPLFCPSPIHSSPSSHWDLSRMHRVPPLLKTLQCSPLEFWITAPTQGFPHTPTFSQRPSFIALWQLSMSILPSESLAKLLSAWAIPPTQSLWNSMHLQAWSSLTSP